MAAGSSGVDRMLKTCAWLLPGLLLVANVQAQTNVYKCVDGPHPVYQQTPCQGRAEWRWEVAAEPGPSSAAAVTERRESRPKPAAMPRRAQAALIAISADPGGCDRARRQRQAALARRVRLDLVQRRQLDDAVYDACR
jgi:hypothetical protein